MTYTSYENCLSLLYSSYVKTAQDSMIQASMEVNKHSEAGHVENVTVSIDGTWQSRGYLAL